MSMTPETRSESHDTLPALVACPMCGAAHGYTLSEGDTYRWWDVHCAACGRLVDTCGSDRRTVLGTYLPKRWPAADETWNAAGKHAAQQAAEVQRLKEHAVILAATAEEVERERCAKLCEEIESSAWALWRATADPTEQGRSIGAEHCADAIRAARQDGEQP